MPVCIPPLKVRKHQAKPQTKKNLEWVIINYQVPQIELRPQRGGLVGCVSLLFDVGK